MPLPDFIEKAFKRINPSTNKENDYYGAYNLLLGHAFPAQKGYIVHPQVSPTEFSRGTVDFVVYLVIFANDIPVFFAEIKPGVAIQSLSARAAADDQMRDRMRDLFDQTPSEIHGVSALGERMCFYCYDKGSGTLDPRPIPRDPESITDTAPVNRWDTDIMSDEGYNRFMDIADHIQALSVLEVSEA